MSAKLTVRCPSLLNTIIKLTRAASDSPRNEWSPRPQDQQFIKRVGYMADGEGLRSDTLQRDGYVHEPST
jgi:hypothetical protein